LAPKKVKKRLISRDYFIAKKLSELAPKKVKKRLISRDYFIAKKQGARFTPGHFTRRITSPAGSLHPPDHFTRGVTAEPCRAQKSPAESPE
jgi:hypothetical protein